MSNRSRTSSLLVPIVALMLTAAGLESCSSAADDAAPTVVTVATTTTIAAATTTSTSTTTTTTTIPPTTTTTLPIITAGALVLVANASSVDGGAGQLTAALRALGFDVSKPTNAAGVEDKLEISKIYVLPGGEPAAESIARLMGGISIFPMPTPAWITGGSERLGFNNVLVMLGNDRATRPLPGLIN